MRAACGSAAGPIEAATLIRWIAAGARDDRRRARPCPVTAGSSRPIGSHRAGIAGSAARRHRRIRRRLDARRHPAGRLRRQRSRRGSMSPSTAWSTPTGRARRRSPSAIMNGRGDQPAGVPGRPARVSSWRGGDGRPSDRPGRLRQAPGAPDQSLGPGRRSGLHPPGLSRRHRPAPRSRRDPRLPRRSRPREAEQAGRPPGRSPRVRRLLGPEVGRPAPQRGEDHGREGRLGLPSLASRPDRPRRPARRAGPPDRRPAWARPGRIPPSSFYRTNRDPTTAAESVAPGLPGHPASSAPDATTTRSTSGPRTTITAWRRSSPTSRARSSTTSARTTSTSTRSTATRSSTWPGRPGSSSRGPASCSSRPSCTARPPGRAVGDNALDPLADWLTRDNRQFDRNLANRVWFHLLGRGIVEPVERLPRLQPARPTPALLDAVTGLLRRPRPAAQAAGRLDHEVADLPGRARSPIPQTAMTSPTSRTRPCGCCPPRCCSTPSARCSRSPSRSGEPPDSLRRRSFRASAGDVPFLKTFGKPERLLTCECERSDSTTLAQAFQMINGPTVRRKLDATDNRIARLMTTKADDRAILNELYLAALCREPKPGRASRGGELPAAKPRPPRRVGRHHLGAPEQQGVPAAALSATPLNANKEYSKRSTELNTKYTKKRLSEVTPLPQ